MLSGSPSAFKLGAFCGDCIIIIASGMEALNNNNNVPFIIGLLHIPGR